MVIKKFNQSESELKKFMQVGIDVNVHVHQFWWVWSLSVSEILLPSKTAKFPFRPMDYSPWSSKNLIDRNLAQKIHASRD